MDRDGDGNPVWRGEVTGLWEVICPACGDDQNVTYVDASPSIKSLRGPYEDQQQAKRVLMDHLGLIY